MRGAAINPSPGIRPAGAPAITAITGSGYIRRTTFASGTAAVTATGVTSYLWTILSAPTGHSMVLADATTATVGFAWGASSGWLTGIYRLKCVVSGPGGSQDVFFTIDQWQETHVDWAAEPAGTRVNGANTTAGGIDYTLSGTGTHTVGATGWTCVGAPSVSSILVFNMTELDPNYDPGNTYDAFLVLDVIPTLGTDSDHVRLGVRPGAASADEWSAHPWYYWSASARLVGEANEPAYANNLSVAPTVATPLAAWIRFTRGSFWIKTRTTGVTPGVRPPLTGWTDGVEFFAQNPAAWGTGLNRGIYSATDTLVVEIVRNGAGFAPAWRDLWIARAEPGRP